MGLPLGSPVAKLSCEAATEENAKRRSFMPRTQVTGKANFSPGITSGLRVIHSQSRKAAANRLRTMSLLGVPDFQAEWFRATPMAPYTHFHEFAFVRRSTYPQRHTIHHTCSLPCNFLPFCELLIRIVSPYQELICSGILGSCFTPFRA